MVKKPNKILFRIGVAMIVIGLLLLIYLVFGVIEQASFSADTPAGSVTVDGISPRSATILTVGVVLILLGSGIVGLAYKFGK